MPKDADVAIASPKLFHNVPNELDHASNGRPTYHPATPKNITSMLAAHIDWSYAVLVTEGLDESAPTMSYAASRPLQQQEG